MSKTSIQLKYFIEIAMSTDDNLTLYSNRIDLNESSEFNSIATSRRNMRMRSRLKLYTGNNDISDISDPQVSIPLGEILQTLSDAVVNDRSWLSDFREDEVKVSADLYEIISAYTHLRPSA